MERASNLRSDYSNYTSCVHGLVLGRRNVGVGVNYWEAPPEAAMKVNTNADVGEGWSWVLWPGTLVVWCCG